jgi:formamidopyrimidine-DNA glycosylase
MVTNDINGLTGIWRSTYQYPSSGRPGKFASEHTVRLRREGKYLIFESLPEGNESYVIVRLALEGNVASGSWQEATSPAGYYKGALYYGVIQMIQSADGKRLRGQWLGFGKDEEVNAGLWDLEYVGETAPERSPAVAA